MTKIPGIEKEEVYSIDSRYLEGHGEEKKTVAFTFASFVAMSMKV